MFHIYCPYCEELREEEEFHPKGQAHIPRPADPDTCSDEVWGDYLFFRDNPRGIHHELWVHAVGCRKFFNITRNTVSYEILETYKMGEQPTITAESLASREMQGNVQVADGGLQTVGASNAARRKRSSASWYEPRRMTATGPDIRARFVSVLHTLG